ncbi:MAG: cupin, partial [Rhizobiales bacterium]|nr:cupin [Hyphomicrobiales bacterium]
VLEGDITLIDNAGEHPLRPGMCAGFKAGVANGHNLLNRGKTPALYLEIGTRSPDERANYPDHDLVGTKTAGKFTFTRKDGSTF